MKRDKAWFESWFNSPYYHVLYQHRDQHEAEQFIDQLIEHLAPPTQARMMDLACGKGRHAIYLASKGFEVTGLDLSEANIKEAQVHAHKLLHFHRHDMREVFRQNAFDYIFNFFTSFGYFDEDADNLSVIEAIHAALHPGGMVVIDFLNVPPVITNLEQEELVEVGGIAFQIKRTFDEAEDKIIKSIAFEADGQSHYFEERLQALRLADFARYLDHAGIEIIQLFGDYDLNPYRSERSDRLIIIGQKKVHA